MRPAAKLKTNETIQCLRVTIRGAVQGVGFRPFVYRLATELNLNGWVNNSPTGVFVEVEGATEKLNAFLLRLEREKPPRSFVQSLESSFLDSIGFTDFQIRPSDEAGAKTAVVLPDIATCADCLREIFDQENRRYLYPFTNCTNCGPRFSIIESLPYDRPRTTMKIFKMCAECLEEYENPLDRRFHAQPNACPKCGPHLELWNENGEILDSHHAALKNAADAIRDGKIVAVKGLGGFHLMTDAGNDEAVKELRKRKHREEKPFALMFPTLAAIEEICEVSEIERRLLASPESPIVLLKTRTGLSDFCRSPHEVRAQNDFGLRIADCGFEVWQTTNPQSAILNLKSEHTYFVRVSAFLRNKISASIAPGNPYLGAMVPYTPLHHLLMKELNFPVVATSGNLSDEPICIDEIEALDRLKSIADLFLIHNRPIRRHVDDSIVREMAGRESVLRRARGFAPLPILLKKETAASILAVGAHLKNAVAAAIGRQTLVSQHIGDLETVQSFRAFENVIASFKKLYEVEPETIVCDAHPDYLSTDFARESGLSLVSVQHHYAHVCACMAENDLDAPVLGAAWDGTGYGADGTIWGGEFLRVGSDDFERTAHFRAFRLPGGDRAIKEPRRVALGMLYEIFGDRVFEMNELAPVRAFTDAEISVMRKVLENNLNAPVTSSAGRLFDGVASVINLRQKIRFEGQAAMELEFAIDDFATEESYGFEIIKSNSGAAVVDWELMIKEIIADWKTNAPAAKIAAKFHNALVETIIAVAHFSGETNVALSGGCFQNKYLLERAVRRLREENFKPYWHQRVPPNDGGIALGQIMAAKRILDFRF
jgi:hydrogenase maturation protein HypF